MDDLPIRRGDVFFADLDPVRGCEQGGIRPVIVVQNNDGNTYSPTLIVACLTKRYKKYIPTHVFLNRFIHGMRYHNTILLEQVYTIDRSRLLRRCKVRNMHVIMPMVDKALAISMGLRKKEEEPS